MAPPAVVSQSSRSDEELLRSAKYAVQKNAEEAPVFKMGSLVIEQQPQLIPSLDATSKIATEAKLVAPQEETIVDEEKKESSCLSDEEKERLTLEWVEDVSRELFHRPRKERMLIEALDSQPGPNMLRTFSIISGPSGSARTCLARSIQPAVDKVGGYLLTGKFEKYTQPIPYGAYVQIIDDFICQVIARGEDQVKLFAQGIEELVGSDVGVLLRWIPALTKVIGVPAGDDEDASHSSHGSSGRMDRLVSAIRNTRRAMDRTGKPIYMLLDNLHYADTPSLEMLSSLLRRAQQCTGYLIATCDNGIAQDSELATRLRNAEDFTRVKIIDIPVEKLDQARIAQALAVGQRMSPEECELTAKVIFDNTGGDYYCTKLCVKWFCMKEVIAFDDKTGTMCTSMEELELLFGGRTGAQVMADKVNAFPADAQEVLKVAACLGYGIQPYIVELIVGRDISGILSDMTEHGLLIQCPRTGTFCFGQDFVQETVHDLIPEKDRALFHLEIGRRLWRKVDEDELDRCVFIILDQMEKGRHLIRREKEKVAVATLCLYAGEQAATSSCFEKALNAFQFGVFLLDEDCWRKEYDLTLSIHSSAAEMLMYAGRYEEMDIVVDHTVEHARSVGDKMRVFACRVHTLSILGRQQECVDLGHEVLAMLGLSVPKSFCKFHGIEDVKTVKRLLKGKSDDALFRLPRSHDKKILEGMRIMSLMMMPALHIKSSSAPLVLLRLMKLTLENGHSIFSAMSFVAYGIFCASRGDINQAFRFGQMALKLQHQEKRLEYLPRVYVAYYGFIHGWKMPISLALRPLLKARDVGISTGDMEFANLASFMYFTCCIETGHKLSEVHKSIQSLRETLSSRRQDSLLLFTAPFAAGVGRLIGAQDDFDFDEYEAQAKSVGVEKAILISTIWKMRMHHSFDEFEQAGRLLESADLSQLTKAPQVIVIGINNLCAMISVANLRIGRNVSFHKKIVRQIKKRFRDWARACPHECSSKFALIEAEWASIHGKNEVAREKYTNAILIAKGMGNTQEVASAHERAMYHYIDVKDLVSAKLHGQRSFEAYRAWGAMAKANHLKHRLERLFGEGRSSQPEFSTMTMMESTMDMKDELPSGMGEHPCCPSKFDYCTMK